MYSCVLYVSVNNTVCKNTGLYALYVKRHVKVFCKIYNNIYNNDNGDEHYSCVMKAELKSSCDGCETTLNALRLSDHSANLFSGPTIIIPDVQ